MPRFRTLIGTMVAVAGVAIAALCVASIGHAPTSVSTPSPAMPTPTPTPTPISGAPAGDYYTVVGAAKRQYEPAQVGAVEYCPLDGLGRAVCAYGELTSSERQAAEKRGKQKITVDPAGWGHNRIVAIPATPGITGSQSYKGWFWNRSHLVADSLGGAASLQNLVTGTRPQNVGSTQVDGHYSGGMAYAEAKARSYLDTHNGDLCPLYYSATPTYDGTALIPTVVTVDMRSCDRTLDERVEISNTANGWAVDYRTGTFAPAR